jgi:hypothetical protein
VSAFLLAWLQGEVDLLEDPTAPYATDTIPGVKGAPEPIGFQPGLGQPVPAVGAPQRLESLLQTVPPPRWAGLDAAAEAAAAAGLPADYVGFLRRFGPGTFCDIRILVPGHDPEFGMETVMAQILADPSRAERYRLLHRDRLPWGVSPDGWLFTWTVESRDPAYWYTGMIGPPMGGAMGRPGVGFAEFLCRYSGHGRGLDMHRHVWWVRAVFRPATR